MNIIAKQHRPANNWKKKYGTFLPNLLIKTKITIYPANSHPTEMA